MNSDATVGVVDRQSANLADPILGPGSDTSRSGLLEEIGLSNAVWTHEGTTRARSAPWSTDSDLIGAQMEGLTPALDEVLPRRTRTRTIVDRGESGADAGDDAEVVAGNSTEARAEARRAFAIDDEDISTFELNPIVKMNSDRVVLLARQYAAKDKFPDEELARLVILTERMRQLSPAVTPKDVESMERVQDSIEQADRANRELRKKLGLG